MSDERDEIILYGTPMCPMIPPARALLERAGAPFQYIDISRDPAAREQVLAINDGYASVPTLVFRDGSTLTEPGISQLKQKLESLGYEAPPPTPWQSIQANPVFAAVGVALLAYGLLDGGWVWAGIGGGLLAFALLKDHFI